MIVAFLCCWRGRREQFEEDRGVGLAFGVEEAWFGEVQRGGDDGARGSEEVPDQGGRLCVVRGGWAGGQRFGVSRALLPAQRDRCHQSTRFREEQQRPGNPFLAFLFRLPLKSPTKGCEFHALSICVEFLFVRVCMNDVNA